MRNSLEVGVDRVYVCIYGGKKEGGFFGRYKGNLNVG